MWLQHREPEGTRGPEFAGQGRGVGSSEVSEQRSDQKRPLAAVATSVEAGRAVRGLLQGLRRQVVAAWASVVMEELMKMAGFWMQVEGQTSRILWEVGWEVQEEEGGWGTDDFAKVLS